MKSFSKNVSCPSSPKLLAFQKGDESSLSANEAAAIAAHLPACDFCAAEVEFYEFFPPVEDKIETEEIPRPLRELAEALLGNRHQDFSLLNKLLPENEGMTLEKV